jgi:hypothetical protein
MSRTTITLDDDVMRRLHAEMRRTGESFKETVNRAIRRGFDRPTARRPGPTEIPVRDLGLHQGLQIDKISELLEQVEGPLHR